MSYLFAEPDGTFLVLDSDGNTRFEVHFMYRAMHLLKVHGSEGWSIKEV